MKILQNKALAFGREPIPNNAKILIITVIIFIIIIIINHGSLAARTQTLVQCIAKVRQMGPTPREKQR